MFALNNSQMGTYTKDEGTKLNTLLEKTFDTEKGFLKATLNEYEEVLGDKDLAPTTSIILNKQKNIILSNLKTVKVLADVD